jgi:alpha-beta hydrolase superfamily lysophospholipase
MRHDLPDRPELGESGGLAYALFLPREEPTAGVVIVHGAGSAKENHFDFARSVRAHGMAALCFDQRGHGRSSGEWGPTALGDVLAMCDLLEPHAPRLALRGSSMGGFCAIHAAALDERIAAVVAICPAPEDFLRRSLRDEAPGRFRVDVDAAERWLGGLDLKEAAASLSPHTALLLMHAEGDEQIPYAVSEELHAAASEPKRLLVLPGGHHRSLQHDLEMQAVSVRFVADAAGPGRGRG